MLSKTIRNAAAGGKRNNIFGIEINEFDLETWAHEARKLESALKMEKLAKAAAWEALDFLEAQNAELRENHVVDCPSCGAEARDIQDLLVHGAGQGD